MPTIVVQDKNGGIKRHSLQQEDVVLGRMNTGNDIVLSAPNVSKRHARLSFQGKKPTVEDLQSTCGTFVNGARVSTKLELNPGDKVYIGDFIIELEGDTEVDVAGDVEMLEEDAPPPDPKAASKATVASPIVQAPPAAQSPVRISSTALPSVPSGAMQVMPSGANQALGTPPPRSAAQQDALYLALASLTTAVEAMYRMVMDERQRAPMSMRAAAAIEETRNALTRFRNGQ